jgi:DNA polymerase-3 subunit gamma/tau
MLSRCADIVHTGLVEMRGTTGPRLLLELICARMLLPGADDSSGALLQRLERMERRLTLAGDEQDLGVRAEPASSAAAPAQPKEEALREEKPQQQPEEPKPRPVPAEAIMPDPVTPEPERPGSTPAALDAAAVRRVWDEILATVGARSKKVAAWLREASVRDIDGDTLILTFRYTFHAQAVAADPGLVVDAVYEVLGGRWEIRCEMAGDQRGGGAGSAPPAPAATPATRAQAAIPPKQPAARPRSAEGRQQTSGARSAGRQRPADGQPGGGKSTGDGDWPEPARPGGAAPVGVPAAAPAVERRVRVPHGSSNPAADSAWADGPPLDEPPFDPEFDGFDPGDEPLDDVVDSKTARQSSEQQALALLQEKLGAEKIAEVEAR